MKLISVRTQPQYAQAAWRDVKAKRTDKHSMVHEEGIMPCLDSTAKLPQWYRLLYGEQVMGSAGIIPNDFINRMD